MFRTPANACALIAGAAMLLPAVEARAANFDCSLIYDEYDSLMSAGFLQMPEEYVEGYRDWLSQPAFDSLQRGRYFLHPERGDTGVMIFRTNHNRHGKLLYYWTDPIADGRRYLMISEAAWFARVSDGAGLELFGRLRANSGRGIDLDTLALVELPVEEEASEDMAVAGSGVDPAIDTSYPDDPVTDGSEPGFQVTADGNITPGEVGRQTESVSTSQALDGNETLPEDTLPVNVALTPDAADLSVILDEESGIYLVSAINGASVFFPTESLCADKTDN